MKSERELRAERRRVQVHDVDVSRDFLAGKRRSWSWCGRGRRRGERAGRRTRDVGIDPVPAFAQLLEVKRACKEAGGVER
jgi:hypothetical protein